MRPRNCSKILRPCGPTRLLEPLQNLLFGLGAVEIAGFADFDAVDLGKLDHALEVKIRIFFGNNIKHLGTDLLPMHLQISKEGCTDRPHHAAIVFDRLAAGTKDNGCISFSYDCLMRHNDLVDNKPAPEIAQDAVFGGLLL